MGLTVLPRVVSTVRRFVEEFVTETAERMGIPAELAERVALTTHELLENVAKYAEDQHGVLRLVCRADAEGQRSLTITVSNVATPTHLDRLRTMFRQISEGPDPMTYYLGLLCRNRAENEAGLGLARVCAEGGMRLSLAIEKDQVSVSATSEMLVPGTGARP